MSKKAKPATQIQAKIVSQAYSVLFLDLFGHISKLI